MGKMEEEKYDELDSKQKEASIVSKIVFRIISILTILMIIVVVSGFFYVKSATGPVDKNNEEDVEIEVPMGSSSSDIAAILSKNDLIKNEMIFKFYLKFKNKSDFQAGEYTLSQSLDFDEIIEELQSGKVEEEPFFKVTIPEGKAAEEIAELFAHRLDFSEKEFLDKLNDEDYISSLQEVYPDLLGDEVLDEDLLVPLEGYLFAGTYEIFEKDPSVEYIIEMMIAQTNELVESELDEIEDGDYSVHEILTLASIIERESKFDEDRPKVAQVFMNRLDEEMKLQSDITAAYANGEHKVLMTYDDIETDSPYNTYVQTGLPPGPISSPSLESIQAVIEPEGKDFKELYFYARPNGETFYTKSLEEHEQVKKQYEKEWHELEEEQSKSDKK
ncbi:MAG TPA: endolytic transglycosylase MltG [Pseudogracilibacillus sp.]|nr:endolytic transglycosylase MltG [Pseudogracilibacillus sp.]